MKKFILILISILLISLCACKNEENLKTPVDKGKTSVYLIPNSYLKYTGTSAEDMAKSCTNLGDKYCTSAKVSNEGVNIELTESQKKNFIKRNDDYADRVVSDFLNCNKMYKCELDKSYKKLTFYYDEKIPTTIQLNSVFGLASGYGLNYMILNNTSDWSVDVTIYNCHTNKKVISFKVPDEHVSFGAKEWEESYND